MFEKYIMIKDNKLIFGQYASTGAWYCKELPANTISEADLLMGEATRICNLHNKGVESKKTGSTPKTVSKVRIG